MNRRIGLGLAVVGLLLAGWCGSARAGLVTWQFEGVITAIDDDNGLVTGIVEVGSPFSVTLTFDPDTPDSLPNSPIGFFESAIVDLSGAIDALPFSGVGKFNSIRVSDEKNNWVVVANYINTPPLGQTSHLYISLTDSSGTAFTNDSLLIVPPFFDSSVFVLQTALENMKIGGQVTSVIPEPTTLSLILAAVGVCAAARRRRPSSLGLLVLAALAAHFASARGQWGGGPVLIGGN